jgi:hypothetical protein
MLSPPKLDRTQSKFRSTSHGKVSPNQITTEDKYLRRSTRTNVWEMYVPEGGCVQVTPHTHQFHIDTGTPHENRTGGYVSINVGESTDRKNGWREERVESISVNLGRRIVIKTPREGIVPWYVTMHWAMVVEGPVLTVGSWQPIIGSSQFQMKGCTVSHFLEFKTLWGLHNI